MITSNSQLCPKQLLSQPLDSTLACLRERAMFSNLYQGHRVAQVEPFTMTRGVVRMGYRTLQTTHVNFVTKIQLYGK